MEPENQANKGKEGWAKERATKRRWNRKWLEANVQLVLGGLVETKSRRGERSRVLNQKRGL
jgi:hypothetical protein